MSLKCSHTESSNCCILLYESIRSSRIVTYVHVSAGADLAFFESGGRTRTLISAR